jgi:hypothetical protein
MSQVDKNLSSSISKSLLSCTFVYSIDSDSHNAPANTMVEERQHLPDLSR